MEISGGIKEDGIVAGNVFDKYGSRNPIVQRIMAGFHDTLSELVEQTVPASVHEIGCGEGYWVIEWNRQGICARGSDFSHQIISLAQQNAETSGVDAQVFSTLSIYNALPEQHSADLIVCCEVLEHLEDPDKALMALQGIVDHRVILSVPREPLWCRLNMMRGKYLLQGGNTPGHIQHWRKNNFVDLVSQYFKIEAVRSPIPWTMVLASRQT